MVLMLGALHTEMAFMKAIGTLLRESGWTTVLAEADVTSSGIADSCLKVAHVARTRRAHQLTACSLSILMKLAYAEYSNSCSITGEATLPFPEWRISMCNSSATFHFWDLILELEVVLMVFLSSLREGKFDVYVESLKRMVGWFFALDQQNYARWLSIHIKDMQDLQAVPSSVLEEFLKGHFVLQKSRRPFSKIGLDHAHEQNNALIKGEGGAVGLTDNPSALRRWMIGGS